MGELEVETPSRPSLRATAHGSASVYLHRDGPAVSSCLSLWLQPHCWDPAGQELPLTSTHPSYSLALDASH